MEPGDPDIHIREGVTYATIDLKQSEFEQYYNGYANDLLWPLFHYFLKGMLLARGARGLRERQSLVREQARAAPAAAGPHLGSRLSPDSARPLPTRGRCAQSARLLPAHPVSEHRDVARAA